MTAEALATFAVLTVGAAFTYLLQYESVISPGYVEFDDRSKKEMKLMKIYNKIMDIAFRAYIALIYMSIFLSYITDSKLFLAAGLYIQLVYFSMALSVMFFMYGRSRIYWKRIEKYEDKMTYLQKNAPNLQ